MFHVDGPSCFTIFVASSLLPSICFGKRLFGIAKEHWLPTRRTFSTMLLSNAKNNKLMNSKKLFLKKSYCYAQRVAHYALIVFLEFLHTACSITVFVTS